MYVFYLRREWRPFWHHFKDSNGRVRDPALWKRIVADGGDEGTPESLRKRIRMLKEAKLHDPRDGTSFEVVPDPADHGDVD